MGEVYRAEDADLARIVAVKLLADRFADNDAIRGRFTREALAVARLSHAPSTVTIFDVGEHDGRPYIVMEYLPRRLARRPSRARGRPAGRPLARLARAGRGGARRGARERDRPPRRQAGEPAARQRRPRQGRRLRSRERGRPRLASPRRERVVGTAGYLAPEQARGERATPASDRYALAVVAFELLTGKRPFERESSTAEAMAHVSAPIPPASRLESRACRARSTTSSPAGSRRSPSTGSAPAAELVAGASRRTRPRRRDDARRAIPPRRAPRRTPALAAAARSLLGGALLAGVLAAALLARDDGETDGRARRRRRRCRRRSRSRARRSSRP